MISDKGATRTPSYFYCGRCERKIMDWDNDACQCAEPFRTYCTEAEIGLRRRLAALESQLSRASAALGDAERAMEAARLKHDRIRCSLGQEEIVDPKMGSVIVPRGTGMVCTCKAAAHNAALDIAITAVRKARTP